MNYLYAGKLQPVRQRHFIVLVSAVSFLCSCKEPVGKGTVAPTADTATIQHRDRMADSFQKTTATPKKMKIYLTFDDGPNKGTMNVLKAVEEEKVPVTFFIVAKHVYDSPWQRNIWESLLANNSVELCNHSYSHGGNRYKYFYKNPKFVIEDFRRSQDSLKFSNHIARTPGRNAWRIGDLVHTDIVESRQAIDSLHAAGFFIMGWDLEWGFNHRSFKPDADTALLFRRIENLLRDSATRTPGHLVLLAHDQAFRTETDLQLLKGFLAGLKKKTEYELLPASKYPGLENK